VETKERLPIDAIVVALDETEHYSFRSGDDQYIEKMLGVYLIDRAEQTCCCEFTPSYYLYHLYDTMVLSAAGRELADEQADRLSQDYEFCGGCDDCYAHCRVIDKLAAENIHVYGATGVSYDDSTYEEQIEGLAEHFRCNRPF
jgi:hypothetical protein